MSDRFQFELDSVIYRCRKRIPPEIVHGTAKIVNQPIDTVSDDADFAELADKLPELQRRIDTIKFFVLAALDDDSAATLRTAMEGLQPFDVARSQRLQAIAAKIVAHVRHDGRIVA